MPSVSRVYSLIMAGLLSFPGITLAEDIAVQQRAALKEIRETAADICYTVQQKGGRDATELAGEIEAKVNGLAAKVATIGVKGSGKVTKETYEGLVQDQIASALKESATCRREVFNKLVERMIPFPPSAKAPAATPPRPPVASSTVTSPTLHRSASAAPTAQAAAQVVRRQTYPALCQDDRGSNWVYSRSQCNNDPLPNDGNGMPIR